MNRDQKQEELEGDALEHARERDLWSSAEQVSNELSSRRTGMSFQRTRMSAERTLMSVIRTALALIGFGFTIYQFFKHLQQAQVLPSASRAPAHFGVALVALGVCMLLLGSGYHIRYMSELRRERSLMARDGLIRGKTGYPMSMTLVTASLLLGIGLSAIVNMLFDLWPFP
jgi:putative membrane protein